MQSQLARLGLDGVRRLPAVDGQQTGVPAGCPLLPGEYACFLSHRAAIESGPSNGCMLVLEDDTELCDQLPGLLANLLQGPLANYDIVFLECQPHISLAHASALWNAASHLLVTDPDDPARRRALGVELLDARPFYKWSAAAYLVTPRGRDKLLVLLRAWLAQPQALPFDRCLEQALVAGQLRGALTVPFLATTGLQWHGRSTIGHGSRLPADSLMVLRRLLYAGSVAEVEPMARAMAQSQADPVLAMFSLVLREMAAWQRGEAIESRARTNPD